MARETIQFNKNSSNVRLENIRKTFVSHDKKSLVNAVMDFNLEIKTGELVTILGPSGCGKTTTLRMIAGFEYPTAGKILFENQDVAMVPPNKRDIAMVFQNYALFPHMNVFDNIAYGLRVKKLPKQEINERTKAIIELMQLEGMEDRNPSQVSGGQQQRIALARAIVVQPKVLLFDEPLSNLDAKLREYMRDEIRNIQKELGITSIYVTHDQDEAMAISDRVIIMKKGYIEQSGTPYDIYESPNSVFVATFMGKANIIPVELIQASGERATIKLLDKEISLERAGDTFSKDKNHVIAIRPESIEINKAEGLYRGVIKKVNYLGSVAEYQIMMGDIKLTISQTNPQLHGTYQEGEEVGINFNLNCVRLLDEGEKA